MDPDALIALLPGAVVAVIVGGVATIFTLAINQRERRSAAEQTQLRDATVTVATSARHMLHVSGTGPYSALDDDKAKDFDSAHLAVRTGAHVLALVGDPAVQEAARLVRHHAYAYREVSLGRVDPRSSFDQTPYVRFENSVELLLRETRKQLVVKGKIVTQFDFVGLTERATSHVKAENDEERGLPAESQPSA